VTEKVGILIWPEKKSIYKNTLNAIIGGYRFANYLVKQTGRIIDYHPVWSTN